MCNILPKAILISTLFVYKTYIIKQYTSTKLGAKWFEVSLNLLVQKLHDIVERQVATSRGTIFNYLLLLF